MKIKYFIFVILFIFSFYIPKREYRELNHLKIIDNIDVICDTNIIIKLREIIPERDNGDINYHYKFYNYEFSNIDELKSIKKNSFYILGVKNYNSNCISKTTFLNNWY